MKLYRYEDVAHATEFKWDLDVRVYLHEYPVKKETRKGYWIDECFGNLKWVSKTSRKRFAHPTIEEARKSFRKRKERQIAILTARLKRAKAALSAPFAFVP